MRYGKKQCLAKTGKKEQKDKKQEINKWKNSM